MVAEPGGRLDVVLALPGPIRQVGYVVPDLDAAADRWVAELGVGPWLTLRDMTLEGLTFRGEPVAPTISIALAQSGELQLELIAQHDDVPSPYSEFLAAGRDGPHHHAWWAEDMDAVLHGSDPEPIYGGDMGGTRFVYFDGVHPSTWTEVMELNDMTRWMAGEVRTAAEDWDGTTDPVRSLG